MKNLTDYYSSVELKLNLGKNELINHNAKIVQTEVVVNPVTREVKRVARHANLDARKALG